MNSKKKAKIILCLVLIAILTHKNHTIFAITHDDTPRVVTYLSSSCPLYDAVRSNNLSQVTALLHNGADVNVVTARGFSPLHLAVAHQNLPIVDALLHAPGIPSIINLSVQTPFANPWDGNTALHIAVRNGSIDIVESLLRLGADPNIVDNKGLTPTDYALLADEPTRNRMVTSLLGVKDTTKPALQIYIESHDRSGNTALIRAVRADYTRIVNAILAIPNICNVINEPDEYGNSALRIAITNHNADILESLLRAHADPNAIYGCDRIHEVPILMRQTPIEYAESMIHPSGNLSDIDDSELSKDQKRINEQYRRIIDILRKYGSK